MYRSMSLALNEVVAHLKHKAVTMFKAGENKGKQGEKQGVNKG